MSGRWRRLAVVALLILGACSPVTMSSGPAVAAASLRTDTLLASDGARLPLRSWLPANDPPRAVVIALHGFNDYSNFFAATGRYLADHGIASYAYDQRGFGGAPNRGVWPGTATLTSDLRDATRLVRSHHPGVPVYLLGESMGGAVVLVTQAGAAPAAADGIILAAPAVWGRSSMAWYQTLALWMAAHTVPDSRVTGRGLGVRPSDNVEMLIALGRDPQVIKETRIDAVFGLVNLMDQAMAAAGQLDSRALILYGENDQLVPAAAISEMLGRLPADPDGRRFALYPNGYHMLLRDLQAEVVWRDIAAWIAAPRRELPSGADRHARQSCPGGKVCASEGRPG